MSLEYIRNYYKVPVEIGTRVTYASMRGVVVGTSGAKLLVKFDDDITLPCHPTWRMDYNPGDDDV